MTLGSGGTKSWIYEPANPAPAAAPVIVFLHGWGAWWPVVYREWIHHLVRRGNIVIFPKYQDTLATLPGHMTGNMEVAVRDALAELAKEGHVHPDPARFAVVGHSLGGVLAANLAARSRESGLPQPLAVMCVEPGDPKHLPAAQPLDRVNMKPQSIMADLSKIPAGTLMIVLVGDADIIVGETTAREIWGRVQHLPAKDRDYVMVVSDHHGSPALDADHVFPSAPPEDSLIAWARGPTDALDYFATWKLLDGLTDAAFFGRNREYALGNTPEQRNMGRWSDGTPVREMKVSDK